MKSATTIRCMFRVTTGATAVLSGCSSNETKTAKNRYALENLVASGPKYKAKFTLPGMVDAWRVSIRPAGAGGHYWGTGVGTSCRFVGNVRRSTDVALLTFFQDDLTEVFIPGADSLTDNSSIGNAAATMFNSAALTSSQFVVPVQKVSVKGVEKTLSGSARFILVTDTSVVSAWTDRERETGATIRANGPYAEMFNGSADGMRSGRFVGATFWQRCKLGRYQCILLRSRSSGGNTRCVWRDSPHLKTMIKKQNTLTR